MVKTKWLKHPYLWVQSVFNSSACNCCGGAVCIIGKTHEAPQQVFRLLFYSLSYFIGAAGFLLSKVLAARKKNLSNARARKNKYTARMLADSLRASSLVKLVYFTRELARRLARRCSQRPFYTPRSLRSRSN